MINENTLNFIRFSSGFNNLKKEELERRRIEAEELRLKNIAELAELHKNQRKNINPFFSKIDHYNKTLTIFFDSPKFISNYDLFKFKELRILFMLFLLFSLF